MKRIPFSTFSSFSTLFKDYTEHFENLAPYFAGDFRSDDELKSVARQAAQNHPDRSALVEAVAAQAIEFGVSSSSKQLLDKLKNPSSVAIVTGQQLGLFGGPLYTLYKVITAIQLADKYEREFGIVAVPIFWLEGEDHDFDEIAAAGFLAGDDVTSLRYSPKESGIKTAIGRLVIQEEMTQTLDALEETLQATDFRNELMSLVRGAYAPGRTMLQAFVTVINAILGDGRVLFISPDDAALKSLCSGLFGKELVDFATSARLLEEASAQLSGSYHAQVQTKPTNLFLHSEGGRTALDATSEGFKTRDGRSFEKDELSALLEEQPSLLSPNVVLRPLMQDTLLPTAVYVAGPGEVAYFAQFKALYSWAGLQMPIIYPRASATLLEKRIDKILDKYGLTIPSFEEQFDRLFGQVVVDQMEVDIEGAFKKAGSFLHQAINEIKPLVEQVDRSLVKSTDATRSGMLKEWTRLKERVLKAERSQQDVVKTQLFRASSNLFPFENPQERALSPLYFLNKYGPTFGQTLISTLDLDTTSHQVIEP